MSLLLVQKCFSSHYHHCWALLSAGLHVSAWSSHGTGYICSFQSNRNFYAGCSPWAVSHRWWERLLKLLLLGLFAWMQANHNWLQKNKGRKVFSWELKTARSCKHKRAQEMSFMCQKMLQTFFIVDKRPSEDENFKTCNHIFIKF